MRADRGELADLLDEAPNWSNAGPSLVGKSWNAPPYEPGPMSPGCRPRSAVFSSVAQASHQSQPNAAQLLQRPWRR